MRDLFAEKKGKIVIIEGDGPLRTQVAEELRAQQFFDIVGVPEVKDALGVLQSQRVSWIISGLFGDQADNNAMQLVKLIIDNPVLRNTKISLTLEDSEAYILQSAFALGMLSWHKKPFTNEAFAKDLGLLIERAQNCGYNSTLLSAMYLREYLQQTGAHQDLLNFERELIKVFPANLQLFLHLVEPTIKVAGADQAKSILRMVKMVSPALGAQVDQKMEQFFQGQKLDEGGDVSSAGFNFLGINRVMVIDSDETVHAQLKELLGAIGIKEIECFTAGAAALEHLKNRPDPDLIIQEWKLHKLSGPTFLQHAKNSGAITTPIIVLSSLLQKDDMPFVREMGIAATIVKPLIKEDVIRTLAFVMQQERLPTDQIVMERKMRALLKRHKITEAAIIKCKYLTDAKIPMGAKTLIEAEFAFHANEFDQARLKAIEAIKYTGDSLFALNLLGKILLRLNEPELALRFFDKAQTLAPQNIDRICAIAEIQADIGQFADANKSLKKAQELDPLGERVMHATATVALQSGDIKTARKVMSEIPAIESVIAAMNNAAVVRINAGQIDEGIAKYRTTLESVPDNRNDLRGLILYNLSLAHARGGRLEDALTALDQTLAQNYGKITAKATALKKKVSAVIKMGGSLVLTTPVISDEAEHDASTGQALGSEPGRGVVASDMTKDVSSLLTLQRGDIGCYMVYRPTKQDERANKLLEKTPKFVAQPALSPELS